MDQLKSTFTIVSSIVLFFSIALFMFLINSVVTKSLSTNSLSTSSYLWMFLKAGKITGINSTLSSTPETGMFLTLAYNKTWDDKLQEANMSSSHGKGEWYTSPYIEIPRVSNLIRTSINLKCFFNDRQDECQTLMIIRFYSCCNKVKRKMVRIQLLKEQGNIQVVQWDDKPPGNDFNKMTVSFFRNSKNEHISIQEINIHVI